MEKSRENMCMNKQIYNVNMSIRSLLHVFTSFQDFYSQQDIYTCIHDDILCDQE